MRRILVVFGTRPEAIKMCPLVLKLREVSWFDVRVCVSGQHKEMLESVLDTFAIAPDYDLRIMRPGQTLFSITSDVLDGIQSVFEQHRPDIILVHGDTTTSYAAALAAFYAQIPIGHVEAGLRTWDLTSPFPEEFNRQSVDMLSSLFFAPTESSRDNLLREGKDEAAVFVTGNTGIDAMNWTICEDYRNEELKWAREGRMVMLTAHRRENLGQPMRSMFRAIRRVVESHPDVRVVYPVHMNPMVRETASIELSGCDNVHLIDPLDVTDFHNFLARSYLVLTDSGGIQEEAPSLGKPVLVMRDTTERPEGVAAGTLKLVGTEEESIFKAFSELLDDDEVYAKMSNAINPYGDGRASERIAQILREKYPS